jgi:LPXTG-motif cell wall-anchored protein
MQNPTSLDSGPPGTRLHFTLRRSLLTTLVLVGALAIAPTAFAQDANLVVRSAAQGSSATAKTPYQSNSGLDEYQEGVPSAGGEVPNGSGSGGGSGQGGSSGSSASSASSSSSTSTPSSTGSSSSTSSAPTEAAANATNDGSGNSRQLPSTGLDTMFLALIGALLLASGLAARRHAARPELDRQQSSRGALFG